MTLEKQLLGKGPAPVPSPSSLSLVPHTCLHLVNTEGDIYSQCRGTWQELRLLGTSYVNGASEVALWQTKASGHNLEGKTAALAALISYNEGCIISLLFLS